MDSESDPDRYIKNRNGKLHYVRRVPKYARPFDDRDRIEITLKTSDIKIARIRRDVLQEADDRMWAGLAEGQRRDTALARYKAAQLRAQALGFTYVASAKIVESAPDDELLGRVFAAEGRNRQDIDAVLGGAREPELLLRDASEIYFDEIVIAELAEYSPEQVRNWKTGKSRAIDYFISVAGNKAVLALDREDGQAFKSFWNEKLAAEGLDPDSARRSVGDVRKFLDEVYNWMGIQRQNPLAGLTFKKRKAKKDKRPSFSNRWLRSKILAPGALDRLNTEAHLIVLAMIETGCRPSEIANLVPEHICLDASVPHIKIRHRDGRIVKTDASERDIPLVGVSLAALKRARNGFERYQDNGNALSATLTKYFRTHGLIERARQTPYSIRHSFEDRMLEAGLDYGFRCKILGHKINRPEYGDGGSMEWRREQLEKVALPVDPRVLPHGAAS